MFLVPLADLRSHFAQEFHQHHKRVRLHVVPVWHLAFLSEGERVYSAHTARSQQTW